MTDPLTSLRIPIVPIEPLPEFSAALLRRIQGIAVPAGRDTASVRYFVEDLDAALAFYRELLGFEVEIRPSPLFAMLYRGDLRLLLSVPGEPHALPGGIVPEAGGHNRIALRVDDLTAMVTGLRRQGARFRTGIVAGASVNTVLLEDPAGNPVELFEPRAGYHERTPQSAHADPRSDDPPITTEEGPQ